MLLRFGSQDYFSLSQACWVALVGRRHVDMVDDDDVYGTFLRLKLQSQLLLQSREERWLVGV